MGLEKKRKNHWIPDLALCRMSIILKVTHQSVLVTFLYNIQLMMNYFLILTHQIEVNKAVQLS